MIKSIIVTNHLGDSIKLELTRPELSGFVVKNIEGLGPVKANMNMTKIAMGDGVVYNSAYIDRRDIVMTLEFLQSETESIEDIRHKSYKYFPIKRKVGIVIETDRRVVKTEGYIEANEPTIFSANEGCSITIACPDPYFYSQEVNEVIFSGVESMFEFPFSNESLDEPMLIMGEIKKKEAEVLFYDGDKEDGITIDIHATGPVSDITIYNISADTRMRLSSHKIGLIFGYYPEWTPNTNYKVGDVVIHKNNIYYYVFDPTFANYIDPDLVRYSTPDSSYGAWLCISGDYVPWKQGATYKQGSRVTYNGKRWVSRLSNNTVTPNATDKINSTNSYYWYEVTNLYPGCGIQAGDLITINTRKGKKSITLLRNGVNTNILNCLDRNSDWFTLQKGDNVFVYDTEEGSSFVEFKMSANIGYDGV